MMGKICFIILVLGAITLCPLLLFSQAPDTIWTKNFGGAGDEQGWSVIETSDGGFAAVGFTESFGAGAEDVYLVKVDMDGNYQWHQTFGGATKDIGRALRETPDKGFIIVGLTNSYGSGNNDVYLIKTDSLGNQEWTRTIGGSSDDRGYDVQVTPDSGFVIAGLTFSYGPGNADVYVIKTNENGNITWQVAYGNSGPERGWWVKQASDGYIIAGNTESFGQGLDVYLLKTNFDGDSVWAKVYGGGGSDRAHSVDVTYDGRFIATGYVGSFGVDATGIWLLKTYANGDTVWTQIFDGIDWDAGYTVRETSDRGYIIAGYTYSYGSGGADFYFVRTDSMGSSLWTKTVGGSVDDRGLDVDITTDGGYISTGFSNSYSSGGSDLYIVRLGVDPQGKEEEQALDRDFSMSILGGNPFQGKIVINLELPYSRQVELSIYNILGQPIKTILDGQIIEGCHSVGWGGLDESGREVKSGVYFLKLDAGEYKITRKLLLFR
jgi:hypothetical protein